MFKHYFERITDVEIYPLISLFVFVVFFVGLIFWVISADKKHFVKMKHIPLEDGADQLSVSSDQ